MPEKLGKPVKSKLFIFSDSFGKMICATAYTRLTFECEGYINRFVSLAMAKIRAKSKTISFLVVELFSIEDRTNVAKIIQGVFETKNKTKCNFLQR